MAATEGLRSGQGQAHPSGPSAPGTAPAARFRFRTAAQGAGYTPVPNVVLEDARLDAVSRFAYVMLLRHALTQPGVACEPGEIAGILAIGRRQAAEALQALVSAGLVSLERGSEGAVATYVLEALDKRYGSPAEAGRPARGPAAVASRGPGPERGSIPELRGAVIPVMTEQRRAFEDRLAARIPMVPAARSIDPALRQTGLRRARDLRDQLRRPPAPEGVEPRYA